ISGSDTLLEGIESIYYYKTYDGFSIKSVDMNKENLDGCKLIKYPIK
ncbi:MAG: linear amide C-N hydrolase, partial [Clostridia bacterium]|nr:linear amide C-N hydrolase [Clostridia bacterium]